MDFSVKSGHIEKQKASTLAVAVFENGVLSSAAHLLNDAHQQLITQALALQDIKGKPGEIQLLLEPASRQRVALFGLGNANEITADTFRKAIDKLLTSVAATQSKDLLIGLDDIRVTDRTNDWLVAQIGELAGNALYRFNQFKSKDNQKTTSLKKIIVHFSDKALASECKPAAQQTLALVDGMNLARDLANLPGNVCTPNYLAEQAKQLGKQNEQLSVKVIDEKEMKQLGMGALLAVSQGSAQPAKLILMEYKGGKKNDAPHAIVGKGITFDTGGISLKPAPDMDQMKFDMCGAASVFGTMKTLLTLQPAINVLGVVVAAENMPSGTATRPGDIVTTLSGQTVEILNTDAEGRLVLCDALSYIERYKPASVIDIATLTGAVIVALGSHATGLMGNNEDLIQTIKQAAEHTRDKVWQLPLWDEYQQQLDSPFADIANIGGPKAGSVTAACFLSRFTKQYRWAHLDIAGTAWIANGPVKGATGRPVPLLTHYLLSQIHAAD